ncbi:hypothetical protein AVEN_78038-1 [Araneus ventricosus]|uniref:Uncharacterized protein n=1 Tax=Araneus ventricosus TaxID=182803 RepID=A0A4Y2FTI5_ARAVE|nr:hypothetical protein AVEN_78038-1 [Araneus ventricosus]
MGNENFHLPPLSWMGHLRTGPRFSPMRTIDSLPIRLDIHERSSPKSVVNAEKNDENWNGVVKSLDIQALHLDGRTIRPGADL